MNSQRGFSLVELMVAMALGLFITGAVSAVFVTSSQTYRTQDSMARLQENARFALSNMQEDIRSAGFRGCLGGTNTTTLPTQILNTLTSPTSFANNFAVGLQGFEGTAGSWAPTLDSAISGGTPAPTTGSDILTVRLADGGGTAVDDKMSSSSAAIPVASTSDFAVGDALMIADCVASTVFRATAVSGSSITHGKNLGRAFDTDASVMPLSVITYFVAPSSNATGNGETSLWQQFDGVNFELADGVERMEILYGEDTSGDLSAEKYVTASNVVDFSKVVSVKISLLMRTVENNISAAGQNYNFNGVGNIAPGDRRVRRTFSTTITLRNRTI